MEKIKKLLQLKFLRLIIVPVFFILLWFVLTLYTIIQLDSSFSVLSYNHTSKNFSLLTNDRILKGQKVIGKFTALENNLGIVSVRFRTFQRVAYEDEDIFVFRIKEKSQHKWYYTHTYKSGLFFNVPFYPFGFPKIANSMGKTYVLELESTRGSSYNGVSISTQEPILASKYQEDKRKLLANKKLLFQFIAKKFINSFQLFDIQFFSFIYLLPFIFFTVLPLKTQNYLINRWTKPIDRLIYRLTKHEAKYFAQVLISVLKLVRIGVVYYFDFVLVFLILLDIFFMQTKNELIYIIIISLWIVMIKRYSMKSTKSFLVSLFLLGLCPFVSLFQVDIITERAAAWGYLFLVVCLVQVLLENIKGQKTKPTKGNA